MGMFADGEFWVRLWGIVLINLALSGDNALVIALAVRELPRKQQFWGRIFGTAGAVVLRLVFIAMTTALLKIPALKLIGGLMLVWLALKLVSPWEGEAHQVRHGTSLWSAVWVIVIADAVMSLDNVLGVVAAAQGDLVLVTFGIALSLPLVVWGSGLLARLMGRFRWIIWLGGGVLGYVAGEMVFGDELVRSAIGPAAPAIGQIVSAAIGVAMAALGWWLARKERVRHHKRGGR